MIIVLRIVFSAIVVLAPIMVVLRIWKFRVARTKKSHKVTRMLILIWCIVSVFSLLPIWFQPFRANSPSINPKEDKQTKTDTLQDEYSNEWAVILKTTNDFEFRIGIYSQMLEKTTERIALASKQIVSTYLYDGTRVDTRVHRSRETKVFERILELHRAGRYEDLIRVCEHQIRMTPQWFTPFLFLAAAQLEMGNTEQARKNMAHFVQYATYDIGYAKADDFLALLKRDLELAEDLSL
ncbi:MAG: hypothetical protein JXN60_06435 [Lentisphaerae bacterium]|nr:hypothetical protein [Lentisphaerota bacterium]